jgi:hypothetical protein
MEKTKFEIVDEKERNLSGTAVTLNPEFEKNGYLVIENLWDPEDLKEGKPETKESRRWNSREEEKFQNLGDDGQVPGSVSRYNIPKYYYASCQIRRKIEKIIGCELYNTYYFDRFYFPENELSRHVDRDSCEISVSVHISGTLEKPWPLWIKTPDVYSDDKKSEILEKGEERYVILNPGDGMIYKGCERPHWRAPMPFSDYVPPEETYYHQIFFHYVLADGFRVHMANDPGG